VAGHPVKLLSRDDQSKPDVAVNQAQDLIFRGKVTGLVAGTWTRWWGPSASRPPDTGCPL